MAKLFVATVVTVDATTSQDTCPGVGQDCKVVGADGLSCCGAEHGPGFAFCQTEPTYTCCSGSTYAVSCGTGLECVVSDAGLPQCQASMTLAQEEANNAQDTCPGVGQDCKVVGADGLSCCGSEHGPGFAFCQTEPTYTCCSGSSYAISCGTGLECVVSDAGLPQCQAAMTLAQESADNAQDTCPGVGQDCKVVGADGLSCCGSEHGPGFAFCQTEPTYTCCSGSSYAISCGTGLECVVSDAGLPQCQAASSLAQESVDSSQDTCPGVGQDCKVVGADGLSCCGSEHGPGFAFCQTEPTYTCCSGSSYAISCGTGLECVVSDAGLPQCQAALAMESREEATAQDTCPGIGQDCTTIGADGLSCCGAEHGPGFAFCQTDPDYVCCSGDKWAISCSSKVGCSVDDQGVPACKKALTMV